MAGTTSRMYDVDEVAVLVADDELFEDEIGDLDLDGESEDEFESVGDFVDASGSQALVTDELLSSANANILAHTAPTPPPHLQNDSLVYFSSLFIFNSHSSFYNFNLYPTLVFSFSTLTFAENQGLQILVIPANCNGWLVLTSLVPRPQISRALGTRL